MSKEMVIPLDEAARRLGVSVIEVVTAIHEGRPRIKLTIDPRPITLEGRLRPH